MGETTAAEHAEPAEQWVLSRREGAITRITLNRPRVLNALTRQMALEIRGALAAALSRYASPAAASSPIGTAVDLLLVSVFGVISRRLIHPELDTESLLAALSRQLGQVLDVPVAPEPAI